jgi:hypothetical protein
MEPLPALPKPTNSGSSRPDPIKPWRHTPHPDPSAWWCPVCKSHTEYKPLEFMGPTYSLSSGGENYDSSYYVSGSCIYTKAICQQCNTIPQIMKGGPKHLGELYHLGRYEPNWGGMLIPKDEKPKDNVLNLTLCTFGVTAVVYMIWGNLRSGLNGLGPPTFNKLFYFFISFFCFGAGLWFLLTLSNRKKWWAWNKWAKQQGGQTSVANLESAAAPTSEPAQQQPETNKGELGHLSPELKNVLELCTLYLVALDEQFTPIEQDWVDSKFGPGTSQRFIQTMGTMDWENCFADIYQQIIQLPPTDQLYLKSSAVPLFQGLMESDGLEGIEQERLDHLMRYIRESLGNA